jgi:hypothetical protein
VKRLILLVGTAVLAFGQNVTVQPGLPSVAGNRHYQGNRAPLRPAPLVKLPIGAVRPGGWLREQMRLMGDGFSGRLPELSSFCKFDGNAWTDPAGHGRFGWEELPYWLKGFIDLGYVMQDQRIIDESKRWVEAVLATQQADGYFGARTNLVGQNTLDNLETLDIWPNMVMLYPLRTYYEATGDKRILPFMLRYFRWFQSLPLEAILQQSWQKHRGGDNLDHLYWLYNQTGEAWLLDAARVNHERTSDWVGGVPTWHGVNVSECFREPAQYYQQTNDERYLKATERNYDLIFGLYGQVTGGGFASDENARPGYRGPRQGTETCTWVEFMFSDEMLTAITGDAKWADRAERIAVNSLPASMTPDLKGLKYLTAPNQVQLDRGNKAPLIDNDGDMLSYNPYGYRCCQHNTAMGWPYYAQRLWMASGGDGLAAVFYAPNTLTAKVAGGAPVTIEETTDYPFGETVTFVVKTTGATRFPLSLRVPEWCAQAQLALNGKALPAARAQQGWLTVERVWNSGDRLVLTLPMKIGVRRWETMLNAASVSYGPLEFSLRIGENWKPYGDNPKWQKYEVFANTPWNYALALDEKMELTRKPGALAAQPFTAEAAPLMIKARARRVPEWRMEPNGLVGEIQLSPVPTTQPLEEVTLIPMGAARLRISMFPVVGAGAPWDANPPMVHASAATHKNPPASKGYAWDGRKGTAEWIEQRYQRPRRLSWSQVAWTASATPASSKLLWWDAATQSWKELRTRGSGEKIEFESVETTALRMQVQMAPRQGLRLEEWRVGGPKE